MVWLTCIPFSVCMSHMGTVNIVLTFSIETTGCAVCLCVFSHEMHRSVYVCVRVCVFMSTSTCLCMCFQ